MAILPTKKKGDVRSQQNSDPEVMLSFFFLVF